MNVAEIGQLHTRYVRLSDKFKSFWTFNQFAAGIYKNFLQLPLPYRIDFQSIYERIRKAGESIHTTVASDAVPAIEAAERDLHRLVDSLVGADERVKPSDVRRFLEKIKQQDEKIIFNLIKFYLYTGAVSGEQRDKLDFLFTKMGEDFVEERGEYWSKDSLELRKQFQSLTAIRPVKFADQHEIVILIRSIRQMKDEVLSAPSFESLTSRNLLDNLRRLKHRIGDQYFHPDVLLAIVDANVTTKNSFLKLYAEEERSLLDGSRKVDEEHEKLARAPSRSPELIEEIGRFRRFRQEFDDSRARSNVKHTVMSQLRQSMNSILAQLDHGLDIPAGESPSDRVAFLLDSQQADRVQSKFGHDPLLYSQLSTIVSTLEEMDPFLGEERIGSDAEVLPLRLEPWEIGAYLKLFSREAMMEDESEELLLLWIRAAALRLLVDEQARNLASLSPGARPSPEELATVRDTLDRAKEYDQQFGDFLHEGIYYTEAAILHRLYRSRYRLLRGFTGLWLIYDPMTKPAS